MQYIIDESALNTVESGRLSGEEEYSANWQKEREGMKKILLFIFSCRITSSLLVLPT